MGEGSKFVAMLGIAGGIPLVVALFEISRTAGTGFLVPAILSSVLLGILGSFIALSTTEGVEFFEESEKAIMWITLVGIILTAAVVWGASL